MSGVPFVHFRPYNGSDILQILSTSPLPIHSRVGDNSAGPYSRLPVEDEKLIWRRYCEALWGSFGKSTTCDLIGFRRLAEKLWKPFVSSIEDGTYAPKEFTKLMVAKRHLLQNEAYIQHGIQIADQDVTMETGVNGKLRKEYVTEAFRLLSPVVREMPYYSKYILCAAYLASFSPQRKDVLFFIKRTENVKRKKNGGKRGRKSKFRKVRIIIQL